ncbi:arginase [Clostridiales bacterium BAD-6]|uniref:Arginase n=1 Tax=Sinanaerobacter chloroacetimidivorans TaxID=2818044 RepID=A0A8J7VZ74_9FIRM|nr:arginase [Sinanaerobacter chloroacetimidivorans]
MRENIHVIGIQMDLGASKRGVNMGPLAIRYAGLMDKLKELGFEALDKGDILSDVAHTENPKMKNFKPIFDANTSLYHQVVASLKENALPVILGGDHCVAAGSISATAQHYGKVGVIWMDAHGDFNSDISSPSGNMHGMPLSALCGYGPDEMIAFTQERTHIDTNNVALVGGRDIDEDERKRLAEAGVHVFSIHDVDRLGMAEVMKRAIAVASEGTAGIHVSFDVDAITPQEAPGVGTPVHSGLTVRESFLAAELVAESGKLLALDMVEVNPILDERNKTGILACELILAFLGKSVY